ncbi:MAG: extracellular solute-binding protein [Rhodobacteraceae bacterium]|nr:extracellular solute-binding protein [Paracoccaceae bacterium]
MSGVVLRGLTWGHRRAVDPMRAAAAAFTAAAPDIRVEWEAQPLSGFEHGLTAALADRYDLIIFDHPFCGAIARDGLFLPLDRWLSGLRDDAFIGRSLPSYRYGGHLWALPIDAATQVSVWRPDLLDPFGPPPRCWEDVVALARAAPARGMHVGLPLLVPHAFMSLMALGTNLGGPFADDPGLPMCDRTILRTALSLLRELAALAHPACPGLNPIGLCQHMMDRNDIVHVPVVYGYLTYAETDLARPLRFAGFPGPAVPHAAGTILGGTGLGITRSCREPEAAARFLHFLASPEVQSAVIGGHHGQPATTASWTEGALDRRFGGAFSGTRPTMEGAWVRPRFAGYIPFQAEAGRLVAAHLAGEIDEPALIERMEAAWRQAGSAASRPPAAGHA